MMNSRDEEDWVKLIRGVRGNGAAQAWYLYKTGHLENAAMDRHQTSNADKAGSPANETSEEPAATASACPAGRRI